MRATKVHKFAHGNPTGFPEMLVQIHGLIASG